MLQNGEIIVESVAICEYLEELYPQNALLPKDPLKKAQVRGFCEIINSSIHPYQNLRMLKKVESEGLDKMKFAGEWVARGTEILEKNLAKTKGKYCFGDEVTLADAFFHPHITGGVVRFGLKIEEYPNCKAVLDNLNQLEAFKLALPKNQPDFEAWWWNGLIELSFNNKNKIIFNPEHLFVPHQFDCFLSLLFFQIFALLFELNNVVFSFFFNVHFHHSRVQFDFGCESFYFFYIFIDKFLKGLDDVEVMTVHDQIFDDIHKNILFAIEFFVIKIVHILELSMIRKWLHFYYFLSIR